MHDANLDAIASLINTPPMSVKIRTATIHTTQLKTRMPFKYGIATMTEVPMLFTKLEIETNGKKTSGISSDLLPPKWFTKVPNESIENEMNKLIDDKQYIDNILKKGREKAFHIADSVLNKVYNALGFYKT